MTIISIAKVIGIITSGEHRTLEGGETLVITDAEIAPFSWMKYIVLSHGDYESGYSQILTLDIIGHHKLALGGEEISHCYTTFLFLLRPSALPRKRTCPQP